MRNPKNVKTPPESHLRLIVITFLIFLLSCSKYTARAREFSIRNLYQEPHISSNELSILSFSPRGLGGSGTGPVFVLLDKIDTQRIINLKWGELYTSVDTAETKLEALANYDSLNFVKWPTGLITENCRFLNPIYAFEQPYCFITPGPHEITVVYCYHSVDVSLGGAFALTKTVTQNGNFKHSFSFNAEAGKIYNVTYRNLITAKESFQLDPILLDATTLYTEDAIKILRKLHDYYHVTDTCKQ